MLCVASRKIIIMSNFFTQKEQSREGSNPGCPDQLWCNILTIFVFIYWIYAAPYKCQKKKFCREQKPYYWINISQNISGTKYGFGNLHPDHATVYYKYLPCDIVTISNSKMQNCLKIFFKRYKTYLSSILENLEKAKTLKLGRREEYILI